ncbi:hypothetical protein COP2_004255 [Malus domestica]
MHQATKYWLGEVVGRSKVEQDQMLTLGFGGQTSVRPVRSYSSARPGPKTRLQSRFLSYCFLGRKLELQPNSKELGFNSMTMSIFAFGKQPTN